MLSLGRHGAIRVTVIELIARPSVLCSQPQWRVHGTNGEWYQVTPRQLRPMPAPTDRHGNAIIASMRADALKLGPAQRGQTISPLRASSPPHSHSGRNCSG